MKRLLLGVMALFALALTSCDEAKKDDPSAPFKIAKKDLTGRTLDEVFAEIDGEKIACNNWAEEYPDTPETTFRAFHTGDKLYIRFDVKERLTYARFAVDNGEVWRDSCCEFYMSLDGKTYYNVEMNCIGYMLIGYYEVPGVNPLRAGLDVLSQVERITTIGNEAFGIREGDNEWSLTMALPTSIFYKDKVESWDGLKITANLYKTGNRPEQSHFITWQPVPLPKPSFHCPQFFKAIEFE